MQRDWNRWKTSLAVVIATTGLAIGCQEGTRYETQKPVVEEAESTLDKAADEAEKQMDKAADAMNDAAEKTRDAAEEAVDAVTPDKPLVDIETPLGDVKVGEDPATGDTNVDVDADK